MLLIKHPLRPLSLILTIGLLVACDFAPWLDETFLSPGSLLFMDDFSNPESGWPRLEESKGKLDYFGGAYRITINQPEYNIWASSGKSYQNVRLEVDVGPISGPIENRFGLICRQQGTRFYFFVISSDGYYGLGKAWDGAFILLTQEMMAYHPIIATGFASNHLRLDCIGDTLAAYVNDRPVAIAHDADLDTGQVGLLAGSFDDAGVDIAFDNFMVKKP